MPQKFRIIFMGTPDFSLPALRRLIDSPHDVVCVYTQPPRPKGRGHKLSPSPVQLLAERHLCPVKTPLSFKRDPDAISSFQSVEADLAVVAAYGLLLPPEVLAAPRFGCLNIHASLLPRWRGASPIQQAIRAGDEESGITIMQMDQGLDTGPIISQKSVTLQPGETASSLHDILAGTGADLIMEVIEQLEIRKTLPHLPQDESAVTYAPLLRREDGQINWLAPAEEIDRLVRAYNPWPGTWTRDRYKGGEIRKHKILEVEPVEMVVGTTPGRLVDKRGLVACGSDTALRIRLIHPAGAHKPMDILSAVNGGYIAVNQAFVI